jgi:hypothetical protein
VDGKAEPVSEAAKLKAELEHEERRFEALVLASDDTHKQIGRLVAEHKPLGKPRRDGNWIARKGDTRLRSKSSQRRETNWTTRRRCSTGSQAAKAAAPRPMRSPAATAIRLWASPAYTRSCA